MMILKNGIAAWLLVTSSFLIAPFKAQALYCADSFKTQPIRLPTEWNTEYPHLEEHYQEALKLIPENGIHQRDPFELSPDAPVLSIVIPAYKEAARLPNSINEIKKFFAEFPYSVEILVRIEKSPDNTAEVALEAAADAPFIQIFPHPVQRGKGYAVRQGMLEARGRYILFMDADLSTPLPEIFQFLSYVQRNPETDVLIGDRHHPDSIIAQKQSFRRQYMGKVFRGFTTSVLRTFGLRGIYDTQAGFKLFSNSATQDIFTRMKTDGFAFDVEALLYANQLGYKVTSHPIRWVDDSRTTVNPLIDPAKMFIDVNKIYFRVKKELRDE